jgi:hypothetical protein
VVYPIRPYSYLKFGWNSHKAKNVSITLPRRALQTLSGPMITNRATFRSSEGFHGWIRARSYDAALWVGEWLRVPSRPSFLMT